LAQFFMRDPAENRRREGLAILARQGWSRSTARPRYSILTPGVPATSDAVQGTAPDLLSLAPLAAHRLPLAP
jgi:hypothetical protein